NGDRLLEIRSAVNDAMSYNIDLRNRSQGTHFPVTQSAQQAPDHLLTRGDLDLFFLGDSLRVLDRDGGGPAAKLDLALPQASWRMIRESRSNFVQAGFLAARTGVEYENFHRSKLRSGRACTVSTGQGASQTTRYKFVDRKRSANLCAAGTASTINSAAV